MRALVVDAYDSFIYIISQYLMKAGVYSEVIRNDQLELDEIQDYSPDFIVLGPGPGHPADSKYSEIIIRYGSTIPLLGVCLGHQAIAMAFGGRIDQAEHLMHGKTSEILHDGKGCFSDIPNKFMATRYHSLIVNREELPNCLEVTCESMDDRYIMGLRHKKYPIESIQFHPESVYTQYGDQLFRNFMRTYVDRSMTTPFMKEVYTDESRTVNSLS